MPRFSLGRLSVTMLVGATCSCESVLSAPEYFAIDGVPARALASRFASGPSECVSCLTATSCGAAFERCAALPGCSEFAECMLEEPSPASNASCVIRLAPSDEIRDATYALEDCYRNCVTECDVGRDFSCVGAYGWPGSLPSGTIRLKHTLSYLHATATGQLDAPVVGAEVTICAPGPDCTTPLDVGEAPLLTDRTGTYEVEIPISRAPAALVGFRGYRLIRGEGHLPHRQQRNTPIVVDLTERTRILSKETTEEIFERLGPENLLASMVLQAFDCRGVGAGGVYFELPESPNALVLYKTGVSIFSFSNGPTLASTEGAAAVMNVEPGRWHHVQARTASGELVAESDVYVPGDAVVLASLYPNVNMR